MQFLGEGVSNLNVMILANKNFWSKAKFNGWCTGRLDCLRVDEVVLGLDYVAALTLSMV